MVREAFGSGKRFLGFSVVACAEWVGTMKHSSTMSDGRKSRSAVCGWVRANVNMKKNGAHKNKNTPHLSHTVEWSI
jgi:hypothetical protein